MSVPATIGPTLAKMLPRLGSSFDGEIVATVKAIERVLKSSGSNWHDLATLVCPPPPASFDWRREARFCAGNFDRLSRREVDFITSLARWRGPPTDKQIAWLRDIAGRLRSAT